jgi:hypothetical protein
MFLSHTFLYNRIVYHCATFVQGGPWAIHISVNVLLWHLVRPQMVHLQVCMYKYVLNSVSLGLVLYWLGPKLSPQLSKHYVDAEFVGHISLCFYVTSTSSGANSRMSNIEQMQHYVRPQ